MRITQVRLDHQLHIDGKHPWIRVYIGRRKSLVGFLHLSEQVRGEDEAVEAFVGGRHNLVLGALPLLVPFIYI